MSKQYIKQLSFKIFLKVLEICAFPAPKSRNFKTPFLLIMLIFGHFWGPLKNQGGAKNGPTNSIRRFLGAQKRPQGAKKSFLEGSEKVPDF